jgi:hypothetical protein
MGVGIFRFDTSRTPGALIFSVRSPRQETPWSVKEETVFEFPASATL